MVDLRIKKWPLWFSIGAAIIFLFLISRNSLARFVWQNYRWPVAAILIDKNDANLAMFIGNYYFNGIIGGGKYNLNVAEIAFKKVVEINPKILWGHYQLARVYFVRGDFNGALVEINNELEANPENLRSLYIRGLIYGYRGQSGDFGKAEADFRRFVEWEPKEWAGYNDLAWILLEQGKNEDAKKTIKMALEKAIYSLKNPWLWNSLGVAEFNLKEYAAAANSFKNAKELALLLTAEDWQKSYPGNDPSKNSEGLSTFLKSIEENIKMNITVDNLQ